MGIILFDHMNTCINDKNTTINNNTKNTKKNNKCGYIHFASCYKLTAHRPTSFGSGVPGCCLIRLCLCTPPLAAWLPGLDRLAFLLL